MVTNWINKIKTLKQVSYKFASTKTEIKDAILSCIKTELLKNKHKILLANQKDINLSTKKKIPYVLIERLTLNEKRIEEMVSGIDKVISLPDQSNKVIEEWVTDKGLKIKKVSVPLGVIFMIYESRPNVTIDSAVLGIKSGNCVILRGGSETVNTNKILVSIINFSIKTVLKKYGIKTFSETILFIDDTSYKLIDLLLKQDKYIDLVIPRGSEKMIKNIKSKSLIPVLSHGSGNCHAYIDEFADIEKSLKVCLNAKVQRPSVCNAIEKILVHKNIAPNFLPSMARIFLANKVELRGCIKTQQLLKKHNINIHLAKEDDWYKEYLDLVLAIKIVNSLDEAISHINKYGSHHSETIMTENIENEKKFINETDSSAIFVNSSTRLHDGGVFGFGTEIGISTSKLHARGTMGLKELTTTKYIVIGDGHIRE